MRITITGSLGHIGQPLAAQLLRAGHTVTIVSSAADRQNAIEALGAHAAIGSVTDAAFLAKAFERADAVYCMVPPNFAAADQVAYYKQVAGAFADAIGRAGVRRVVALSSYGAHLPSGTGFIEGAYHLEQIFSKLPGITVTYIRAGYFYYNLLGFINPIRYTGAIAANYGGDDKLVLVAPTDIAKAIAEELTTTGSGVRYVVSDDRSCAEIAAVLGKHIGLPGLQWKTQSSEEMQAALTAHGLPPHVAAALTELGNAIHTGRLREDYNEHGSVTGQVKLEDYAPVFAAAYQQQSA